MDSKEPLELVYSQFDPCNLPIVAFQPISQGDKQELSDDAKTNLSQDQCYLYRACLVVQVGYSNATPADIKFLFTTSPGNLSHARWLTCANRMLRLYMSTLQPSNDLLKIVDYIVQSMHRVGFRLKVIHI